VTNKATPDAGYRQHREGEGGSAGGPVTSLNGTQLMTPSGEAGVDQLRAHRHPGPGPVGAARHAVPVADRHQGQRQGDRGPRYDAVPRFDFDIIQFGFSNSPLLTGDHDLWYKGAGNNFTNWSDPQSDQLLNQMSQTLDPQKQGRSAQPAGRHYGEGLRHPCAVPEAEPAVATNQYINIRDNNAGSYFTYNTQEWGLNASAQ